MRKCINGCQYDASALNVITKCTVFLFINKIYGIDSNTYILSKSNEFQHKQNRRIKKEKRTPEDEKKNLTTIHRDVKNYNQIETNVLAYSYSKRVCEDSRIGFAYI